MNTLTDTDSLFDLIANGMLRDQFRFRRRFAKLQHQKNQSEHALQLARLERDIQASALLRAERLASLPAPTFPNNLPVSDRRDEISAAIKKIRYQSTIVSNIRNNCALVPILHKFLKYVLSCYQTRSRSFCLNQLSLLYFNTKRLINE